MRIKKRHLRQNATVDLVPMIDIVFQLILFFLVSTTVALLPGISVNLPESSTSESVATTGITILATEKGNLYFNDKEVSFSSIDKVISDFDTNGKPKEDIPIILEADSNVTNGTIVKIFDVLRKNGYSAVNLRTTVKK